MLAGTATLAGIMRELWLVPQLGEQTAHQLGTLIVTAAFLVVIGTFVHRMELDTDEALVIGIGWLAGAIAFEFGLGRYVDGLSWGRLLADYDLTRGRLLLLVWLTVGIGPYVFARIFGLRRDATT
jgi:hypothetical protein